MNESLITQSLHMFFRTFERNRGTPSASRRRSIAVWTRKCSYTVDSTTLRDIRLNYL